MKWQEETDFIRGDFEFANFSEAFAFLTQVAMLAEKFNHHPEIHNIYNKVSITLSTHDMGNTVTDKDRALAKEISLLL